MSYYSCPRCNQNDLLWLHSRKDGGPDQRYSANPQLCAACGWRSDRLSFQQVVLLLLLVIVGLPAIGGLVVLMFVLAGGDRERGNQVAAYRPSQQAKAPDSPASLYSTENDPVEVKKARLEKTRLEKEKRDAELDAAFAYRAAENLRLAGEERLRTEAERKKAKAKAEVEAKAYAAAMYEYKAMVKLHWARELDRSGETDAANSRYKKIIAEYPGTDASLDAKDLLAPKEVPDRPLPPLPIPPDSVPADVVKAESPPAGTAGTKLTKSPGSAPILFDPPPTSESGGSKTVQVAGYYRPDGKFVSPYSRSTAGSGGGRK